ncbi:uncharacterized protein LOC132714671, partial [Ruditapes philippinarum]|uniref:uncharacterized protein LOC132714671 n=1 Tax=Ruditapes philippinarum TaxID=129788 RepID=UPI00295AD984
MVKLHRCANGSGSILLANAFPSHRVQKLLNCSQYEDVLKKVDVEGLFLQLNEDGSPLRQVFLAMTQKEVLIVEQEIPGFKPTAHGEIDTDTEGLSVDELLPLSTIRFLILDDITKYLTIITYTGQKFRFEMCQLDSSSTKSWGKWRETIMTLNGDQIRTTCDPEDWKTSSVVYLNNGTATHNVERGAGVQPKESSIDSSSSSEDINHKIKLGYYLSDRLCVLYTRSKFSPCDYIEHDCCTRLHSDENMTDINGDMMEPCSEESLNSYSEISKQIVPRKTRSLNDLLDKQCRVFDIKTTKELLSLKRDERVKNEFSNKDRFYSESESSSDSEGEMDDKINLLTGIPSVMQSQGQGRTASDLWSLVRTYFIKRKRFKVIGRFQDIVRQVHFRILSQRF